MKNLVWLDCDPGHDDALAIILAGHDPNIELIGISTVCGNQSVDKTTINALKVCQVSGLNHIDVVKGQHKSLVREERECPDIHGDSGLDGTTFPKLTKTAIQEKGVIYMAKIIKQQKQKVSIVGTAQLTNIALLLSIYPEIKPQIKEIVILGGSIGVGNYPTPNAEWNIYCDPEAFQIITNSGLKVTQVPIEVTHTALVTPKIIEKINSLNSNFSKLITELLLFFAKTYKKVFNFQDPPLHDPLAVLYVAYPELFKSELLRVDVETKGDLCQGRTSVDIFKISKKPKNVNVCMKVDVDKFFEKMLFAIQQANKLSEMNK